MDSTIATKMTEAELHSQQELQQKINARLEREKVYRETHPGADTKQMYDCSMGMSKILESISVASLHNDDRRQTFDVFIINGLTIARNCYDKHKSITEMLRAMRKDINLFMSYVQNYFVTNLQNSMIEKPYVICYLPEYKLKEERIRPLDGDRKKIYDLAALFFKKACTSNLQEVEIAGGKLYMKKMGTNTYPHKELASFIRDIGDKGVMRHMQRRYLLVSHIPLDFHLQNTLGGKLYILESYTGKIKPTSVLGEKVFKEDLPFNQYTHLLFGDQYLIKPMIHRNEKKKMLEVAKKNHWTKKPVSLILSDIRRTNIVPIEVLTSVKF